MVEVDEGRRSKVVVSCLYPIKAGLKVYTDSERIKNVRRWILQMLVDECPACPEMQDLAKTYGVTPSAVQKPANETIAFPLCGLCVRACEEVAGVGPILRQPGGEQRNNHPLSRPQCRVHRLRDLSVRLSHRGHGPTVLRGSGRLSSLTPGTREDLAMADDVKLGVFLCDCGLRIGGRLDLQALRKSSSRRPAGDLRGSRPFPCQGPGLAALTRAKSRPKG